MIPNLFTKQEIPKNIPHQILDKIKELSEGANEEEFLEKCFFYVAARGDIKRAGLIINFFGLFQKDVSRIIEHDGHIHCTNLNFLLRTMLIISDLFEDSDIALKWTNTWYVVPHQYLQIKLSNNEMITLDPWNYRFGIDYGEYGSGFKSLHIQPIR